MISVCALTMNRYELAKRSFDLALEHHGYKGPVELLVADQGSSDPRVIQDVASRRPAYHRLNRRNEGIAKAFNQLMARAKGDYIAIIGNDIELPAGWLEILKRHADLIPRSGIIGLRCTTPLPPLQEQHGVWAHYLNSTVDKVFGTMFFRRELFDVIGGFDELPGPYGLEDSLFNYRVNGAGYISAYVPEVMAVSNHIGWDIGESSEYRKMKDASLVVNFPVMNSLIDKIKAGDLFLPRPVLLEPTV